MPSTPDWKKEAEEKYNRDREDIRHESKSGFAFHILILVVIAVIFVVFRVVEWLLGSGDLLPTRQDAVWAASGIAIIIIGGYVGERYEEAKSVREQRLIRLEMKIDALLDRQERIDSRLADLREEVRESCSR